MLSLFGDSRKIPVAFIGAAVGAAAFGSAAQAGIVYLGGGWQVEWDPYYDAQNLVDINPDGVSGDGSTVFFEKIVDFRDGPDNGIFPSFALIFSIQAGYTGTIASNLVITDEVIKNNTGVDWTDFHLDLLDHGEVTFNPTLSAGFSIAPFQNFAYSGGNAHLDIWGGVVANGATWQPGVGPGQLWIHVNNVNAGSVFTLKETPTPAPGAFALLGLAAMVGSRRRRRD